MVAVRSDSLKVEPLGQVPDLGQWRAPLRLVPLLADEPAPQTDVERPKLALVPPPRPTRYEIALRAWVSTEYESLRGFCVFVDESGCEIHGQGGGLEVGQVVLVKIERRAGELITARARVMESSRVRAFLSFEELPLDTWDDLAGLMVDARRPSR
jgi:hypothetical protein